ncbi:MAG: FHA domain-containing protein [Desulfobulbaceae bacterium]|nr:FHA domain-containing protein [Desulfobulbaceae bacterium]MCK5543959.1 FHA domain-containing protein [Desulfobulbaceae bacterium]
MTEWTLMLNDRVIKSFQMTEGLKVTIGRGADADIVIDNTGISRLHSSFELKNDIYLLSDLESLNGTFVNGKKITSMVPVSEEDVIEIAKFKLMVRPHEGSAAATSSTDFMDEDEETVFVSKWKGKPTGTQTVKGRAKTRLVVIEGEASVDEVGLDGKSSVKIGKDSSSDLVISGFFVAAAQCYIMNRDGKFFIVPQRSWVGTRLNGLKLKEEHLLRKGDVIEIKRVKIRFE